MSKSNSRVKSPLRFFHLSLQYCTNQFVMNRNVHYRKKNLLTSTVCCLEMEFHCVVTTSDDGNE